jgi:hypothetical protein
MIAFKYGNINNYSRKRSGCKRRRLPFKITRKMVGIRHALERDAVLCSGIVIGADDFDFLQSRPPEEGPKHSTAPVPVHSSPEREWILNVLVEHRYRRSETAAALNGTKIRPFGMFFFAPQGL